MISLCASQKHAGEAKSAQRKRTEQDVDRGLTVTNEPVRSAKILMKPTACTSWRPFNAHRAGFASGRAHARTEVEREKGNPKGFCCSFAVVCYDFHRIRATLTEAS